MKEVVTSRFQKGKSPHFPQGLRLRALTVKESLGFLCHPTRQHNTLAWGSWAEGLGGLVFLAYGPEPRTTAMSEREELEPAEGAIQLALGEQVSREQAPRLCPWLPILWLEHIIFQLLHTLRWLHLSCQRTMEVCGMPAY